MAPLLNASVLFLLFVAGLIGFHCGDHGFNITILSLLDIGDYEVARIENSTEETYMLLNDSYQIMIVQSSSNARWKLIARSFTMGLIHKSLLYKTIAGYSYRSCRILPTNSYTKVEYYLWRECDHFRSLTK